MLLSTNITFNIAFSRKKQKPSYETWTQSNCDNTENSLKQMHQCTVIEQWERQSPYLRQYRADLQEWADRVHAIDSARNIESPFAKSLLQSIISVENLSNL